MNNICLVCGSHFTEKSQRYLQTDRRKGLKGCWQFVECDSCGVIFMETMPTVDQMAAYYAAYSKDEKVDVSRQLGSRYPSLRKLFHCLSGDVDPRDFVRIPKGARVLDFGCGRVGYLSDFHNRGVAISGAEIAGYLVEECQKQGFDVHKVDNFLQIPFADNEFDIVYLMQVFEHLCGPHEFMSELSRVLKDDGLLYLAIPNVASIWRKVFGNNWVSGWFAPFHLFLYNREALENLAKQHGFVVVDSWSSTPVMWFRLNLKALLYPKESELDSRSSLLDNRLGSCVLMLLLRVIELLFRERDCLIMKLRRRGSDVR